MSEAKEMNECDISPEGEKKTARATLINALYWNSEQRRPMVTQ